MFDCVAGGIAQRYTQQGMKANARLGQRPRETVCLLEKPLLTPQGLGCCPEGPSPRALLAMTCLHSRLVALATPGNSQTQTNELPGIQLSKAWGEPDPEPPQWKARCYVLEISRDMDRIILESPLSGS